MTNDDDDVYADVNDGTDFLLLRRCQTGPESVTGIGNRPTVSDSCPIRTLAAFAARGLIGQESDTVDRLPIPVTDLGPV